MSDTAHTPGGYDPRNRGESGRGYEYPPPTHATGGYHYPDVPPPGEPRPSEPEREDERREEPVAAARFHRQTRARSKQIPALRQQRPWRLLVVTVLFVMAVGSWAEAVSPLVRAFAHVGFWAALALAALATVYRERRNGWPPAARWPWPTAAVLGTILAEVLVLTVGPSTVMVGSVVVLALGLFLALMFG
ncbi:hypothetical protein FHX37_0170 [Haloactinospora alba]|uniref:Uncharacterized protein n=1 Tax=Haloactinospora alba TaxID=405555 RepID=A0A543NEM9_9ACTN|nr:hypothetical protein [Haloactinospora alba]TQN30298.1 hypothetical protein FHX37_0170 [Haloactinospora alba]